MDKVTNDQPKFCDYLKHGIKKKKQCHELTLLQTDMENNIMNLIYWISGFHKWLNLEEMV